MEAAATAPDSAIAERPPIASRAETELAIGRLGAVRRELAIIEQRKGAAVARASADAEEKATPLQFEAAELERRIEAFCSDHKAELTGGKSKTVAFATGAVAWRLGKGRVVVDRTPAVLTKVIARLAKLGGQFIRTKVEPDVAAIGDAIRKDRKAAVGRIPGITFEEPAEAFSIEPIEAPLAPA